MTATTKRVILGVLHAAWQEAKLEADPDMYGDPERPLIKKKLRAARRECGQLLRAMVAIEELPEEGAKNA